MSDSVVFSRRDFLKLTGVGAAGAAAGCSNRTEKLIPYLVAPEDILPGVPYWYASTCRECPAGCGVLVKTREGRAIKIEGNPAHPINQGALCARGQAALQGLYDPDRVATPMLKQSGQWKKLTWDEALKTAADRIGQARANRRGIALISEHAPGSFEKLCGEWTASAGATHLVYEPFAHQALREANKRVFGRAEVPNFDFGSAKGVISFGADFLETWGSPVANSRGFAALKARADTWFVAVEPRLSMTGANADEWVAIPAGGEMALALGLAHVIVTEGLGAGSERAAFLDAVSSYTPEEVERQTGVKAADVQRLARKFAGSTPSLAVAGGIASQSEQSVGTIAAVQLLNYVAGNVGRTVRFDRTLEYSAVASLSELQRLASTMSQGGVDVAIVHGTNPVYATPSWSGFTAGFDKVPFKIAIASALDETAERCDLILPATHALESLGDAAPARGVYTIIQPAMRKLPMFDARPAGDTLIALAKAAGFGASLPASWTEYVKAQWRPMHQRFGAGRDFAAFWNETLKNGGIWEDAPATAVHWSGTPAFAAPQLRGAGDFALVLYPSNAFFDGRGANKPWLQELPDPTTKAVWGSWVEIHPEAAEKLGIQNGDAVKVETEAGSVEVPAYLYRGIRKDTIAIPLGQGHTAYGRYASGRGVNPLALLPPAQDASGATAYLSAKAKITKIAKVLDLVVTQRAMDQHDREIARIIPIAELGLAPGETRVDMARPHAHAEAAHGEGEAHAAAGNEIENPAQRMPGRHTEPRALAAGEETPAHAHTAFVPREVLRAPRQIPVSQGNYGTAKHRWAMSVDINSCTGCSACVVACNAENNVPVVGPELIKRGREMQWIRIERYEERVGAGGSDVRFVPMMCQHCTDAPCEIVCPVYATYHNPEGLNAQVYNRCVGTRYCSNNCPYKVRAFNWHDYAAPEKPTFAFPEPLNWQLNPDVTVRSKGVMEKCTMCVQRILEGKGNARDENRTLADGDIKTACQQSCPTQAIVFGDLLDPKSRVSQLSHGGRAYWVLDDLNTKPGVTYLKKVARETV